MILAETPLTRLYWEPVLSALSFPFPTIVPSNQSAHKLCSHARPHPNVEYK
ncbi:unnamed protein product [Hymenolepis diminuta]|uniref:Uncharacterized protein n=1 Tax=Hymenolepis diminuta TaxID=6216 RepID=A0A564YEA9_HYMDI|nr:unnamed protein product [Hymenolepis diminuta]